MNIAGRAEEQSVYSPAGCYLVMDDYTERDDIPITSNYKLLGIGEPPRSYGLYIDGERVSPLLKELPRDLSYLKGSLAYFPYTIRRRPSVLLIGTDGGFKILETARSGAQRIVALEEQRVPYRLIDTTFRRWDPQYWKSFSVELLQGTVHAVLRRARERFDIIEIAAHHLRSALQALRVKEPAAHIVLYRTAWTCQILVSNQAFSTEDIPP